MSISTSCGVGFLRAMFNWFNSASDATVPNARISLVLMVVAPSAIVLTSSIFISFLLLRQYDFNCLIVCSITHINNRTTLFLFPPLILDIA
jgi:hypothetical protein